MVWLAPRGLRFAFFERTEMRPGRQAGDAGIAPSFGLKVERIVELSAA
jgi:hypothetical protein